ncbi:MAG TPA: helix-turn-helix transcriptional regulator [Thermomicrobiales bacterium]|jgi:hypothetical protein
MITNDEQRAITKREAEKFRNALDAAVAKSADEADPEERAWLGIFADAFQSQLADLEEDLAEYEALRTGEAVVVPLESVAQLPAVLIKARIASGLSERQLATRLGVEESVVLRAEATGYDAASLGLMRDVARALGVELRGEATIPGDRAAD